MMATLFFKPTVKIIMHILFPPPKGQTLQDIKRLDELRLQMELGWLGLPVSHPLVTYIDLNFSIVRLCRLSKVRVFLSKMLCHTIVLTTVHHFAHYPTRWTVIFVHLHPKQLVLHHYCMIPLPFTWRLDSFTMLLLRMTTLNSNMFLSLPFLLCTIPSSFTWRLDSLTTLLLRTITLNSDMSLSLPFLLGGVY